MAGAEGFEPSTKVLETHVLTLHHASIAFATVGIIRENILLVKDKERESAVWSFQRTNRNRTVEHMKNDQTEFAYFSA